jgi:hypothetical protein
VHVSSDLTRTPASLRKNGISTQSTSVQVNTSSIEVHPRKMPVLLSIEFKMPTIEFAILRRASGFAVKMVAAGLAPPEVRCGHFVSAAGNTEKKKYQTVIDQTLKFVYHISIPFMLDAAELLSCFTVACSFTICSKIIC